MKITKTSVMTGAINTLDLPVTQEELDRHNNGELAQREFLISGITPEEWQREIGDDPEI